jgi:hypothetical protein
VRRPYSRRNFCIIFCRSTLVGVSSVVRDPRIHKTELPLSAAIVTMVKPPRPPPSARDKRAALLAAEREKRRAALLASISSAPVPQAPATPSRNPHDTRSLLQRDSGETPRSARYHTSRAAPKMEVQTQSPIFYIPRNSVEIKKLKLRRQIRLDGIGF